MTCKNRSFGMALWAAATGVAALVAPGLAAAAPTEVKALFREGQTFLTWREDPSARGESYRVYRHARAITAENLAQVRMIAEVPEGSSRFEEMWTTDGSKLVSGGRAGTPEWVIPRLCIEPVTDDNKPRMLPEGTGLLVWTVKEGRCASHYAVTTVVDGKEDKTVAKANTCGPIEERKEPVGAVKYHLQTAKDKKTGEVRPDREWYIMWMDYELWNPHYIGYAFPFAITLRSFKAGGTCPSAHLDGIGTMNVFTAGYTNYGCGDFSRNALPTWYFGYGTKVRSRAGGRDVKQEIGNYVQYRILQTVLWARRKYKIIDPRFVINGNSMGAAGAIGFALAYPKFVTAIWSNQGMTDYADTMSVRQGRPVRLWASSILGNYGKIELANPVRNLPFGDERLDWNLQFNGMNVYDYRNAAKFLAKNVAEDFPLLGIGHTFQDGSIPCKNQALPFEKYIKDSRHCFCYTLARGGHGWGSAWGSGRMTWLMRWDESRPGFSNVPAVTGWRYNKKDPTSRTYLFKVAWGVKAKPVKGKAIAETETSWTLPIIHEARPGQEEDYEVDVTPRNLQKLKVAAGDTFTYEVKTLDAAKTESSGQITADEHNLLLIPKVPIRRSGALVEVRLKARGPGSRSRP